MVVIGYMVLLVIENDIRSPQFVGGNSDELDVVELHGRPPQLVVVPNLSRTGAANTVVDNMNTSANHRFMLYEYCYFNELNYWK